MVWLIWTTYAALYTVAWVALILCTKLAAGELPYGSPDSEYELSLLALSCSKTLLDRLLTLGMQSLHHNHYLIDHAAVTPIGFCAISTPPKIVLAIPAVFVTYHVFLICVVSPIWHTYKIYFDNQNQNHMS